jgi:DNA-binding NtrC family response regulator
MKAGAYDYIVKPFDSDQLKYAIDRALGTRELKSEVLRLRHEHGRRTHARKLVGNSLAIKQLRELIARVAVANPPVLIQGESGTGKELVADAIHESSPRASRALIKVNCSAIPADLVESELFGHEKGAYTGADRAKAGLFELADGGTLFLDEISEMQLALQPKLLRVIEGHSFRRVGGVKDTSVDVRLVAATNNDLRACVDAGTFRADLFYRLGVLVIDVPPLRVRTEDVLLIAETVIEELRVETGKSVSGLSKEAQELLVGYSWPGNVRELRNVLERAVILADSILLEPADFPSELSTHPDLHQMEPETEKAVPKSLESIERSHIAQVLAFTGGNKTEAAKRLGIARSTLKEKIKNLKID